MDVKQKREWERHAYLAFGRWLAFIMGAGAVGMMWAVDREVTDVPSGLVFIAGVLLAAFIAAFAMIDVEAYKSSSSEEKQADAGDGGDR